MKFIKKLWDITGDLSWTLAGSVIVIITLSGPTQTFALWVTICATALHYIYKISSDSGE